MLSSADLYGKQQSVAFRRKDQLDRWVNSATDQQSTHRKEADGKVNFDRGTVFLAACSQSDKKEVEELLQKGVDPNTANVDGLTGLHQVNLFLQSPSRFLLSDQTKKQGCWLPITPLSRFHLLKLGAVVWFWLITNVSEVISRLTSVA